MSLLTFLQTVFKALKFLWPFIAEMFFAGKSAKQIVLENKFAFFLVLLLALSFTVNYVTMSKIYEIAMIRSRDNDPNQNKSGSKGPTDKPVATEPYPPPPKPVDPTGASDFDPHHHVRDRLEKIYRGH